MNDRIRDPNVDAMFRNGQQPQATLATPFNDIQLVALLGSILGASNPGQVTPEQAVATAVELVAESIMHVSGGGLNQALERAKEKRSLAAATLLPTQ